MRRFLNTSASLALVVVLTACGSLPTKEKNTFPSMSSQTQNFLIPVAPVEVLAARTKADSFFIMGDVSSHEGKAAQAIEFFEKVTALDPASSYVHIRLAAEYLKINKIDMAILNAQRAVEKEPRNIEAHLLLGGLYSTDKSYDQAVAQYNIVLRLQPQNNEAPIYIGSLYLDQKEYKKAEHSFKSLLKNPAYETPHLVHYYLGLLHLEQKGAQHSKAAEMAFKKSLELKPDFEEALLSLADLYLQQKNRGKALTVGLEFQKRQSFSLKIADMIAQIYIEEGMADKAYDQFELMASHSEPSLDLQIKMALLLIDQKRFLQAASKLQDIVARYPTADGARYYLAAVYEQNGDLKKALHEYMLVPSSSAHFSQSIVHAAYLLKGMGKINQALALLEKGLKTAAQPQVYNMYASLLDAKSDYLGAARILEEGLSKYSQNAELLFQHALILDRLGQKESMITQMKKFLEIEPNHVQGLSYLAFTMAELSQHLAEAERLARRALELDPNDGYVLDTLGWVLFKQKKFADSIQILERAYASESSASIIAEHLADAYSMQSQTEKAKTMYNIAASLTKDETRSKEIRAKMK